MEWVLWRQRFTFYLFHSFLSWRLSVFGHADQFWAAFFLSFLHGFLSFFVVSLGLSCVFARYHSWAGRWLQGEDLPSASKTVRQETHGRTMENPQAGSTFSRAWWRTDKPIKTLLFHPFTANSRRGMIQYDSLCRKIYQNVYLMKYSPAFQVLRFVESTSLIGSVLAGEFQWLINCLISSSMYGYFNPQCRQML